MKQNRLQSISLIVLATIFAGLSSCQKEINTDEPAIASSGNTEIRAKSYREFDSLLRADPGLVIKINDADFNDPDEKMSEEQFLEKAVLVKMPGTSTVDPGLYGRPQDQVVTLPEVVVYGSWPEFPKPCSLNYLCTRNYLIAFPSYHYYINLGLSNLLAIYNVKKNDPLSSVVNTNILPDFWASNNGRGKIKYVLEKIDNSHYKASIGVTSGLLPYSSGISKGSIELILNTITPTFDAPFQSASFKKGTGGAIVGIGGSTVTITQGRYSFTINNKGDMSAIKYNGTTGQRSIWVTGSPRANTVSVGTAVGVKGIQFYFEGGLDNGHATGSFGTSYGGLNAYIKATTNDLAAGIEFSYSTLF